MIEYKDKLLSMNDQQWKVVYSCAMRLLQANKDEVDTIRQLKWEVSVINDDETNNAFVLPVSWSLHVGIGKRWKLMPGTRNTLAMIAFNTLLRACVLELLRDEIWLHYWIIGTWSFLSTPYFSAVTFVDSWLNLNFVLRASRRWWHTWQFTEILHGHTMHALVTFI